MPINDININNIQTNSSGIHIIRSLRTNNVNVYDQGVRQINLRQIADRRVWVSEPPQAVPVDLPVVTIIGTPIVDMPGCVKVHKENAKNPKNKNNQLVNDDPKQNVVLCDGGMPYFEPPNYDYRELTWQTITQDQPEAGGIDTGDPPTPDIDTPEPPVTPGETAKEPDCPPNNARRIGDLNQAGTEKVTGYKLSVDKTECITLWADVPAVEQFLPSIPVVSTTATIAAVATTSALLAKPIADLLLKVVKPVIKKAIGKVQKILGKTPQRPSRSEVLADRYREKKGLLPLKKLKKKK